MTEPTGAVDANQSSCDDCGRHATKSYGASWLCRACWALELARIYTRRKDLLPQIGQGYPSADDSVRCWTCGATWWGKPLEWCWWCNERHRGMHAAQESMDRDRFVDYLARITDGDRAAVAPAVGLAKRVPNGDRLLANTLAKWQVA